MGIIMNFKVGDYVLGTTLPDIEYRITHSKCKHPFKVIKIYEADYSITIQVHADDLDNECEVNIFRVNAKHFKLLDLSIFTELGD